ncbi:hypothetical protein BS78_07G180700 [Paspalum vaginatum]|nr:hypothetical protein BS78_07G180700 [Paspalum vaginatum]
MAAHLNLADRSTYLAIRHGHGASMSIFSSLRARRRSPWPVVGDDRSVCHAATPDSPHAAPSSNRRDTVIGTSAHMTTRSRDFMLMVARRVVQN